MHRHAFGCLTPRRRTDARTLAVARQIRHCPGARDGYRMSRKAQATTYFTTVSRAADRRAAARDRGAGGDFRPASRAVRSWSAERLEVVVADVAADFAAECGALHVGVAEVETDEHPCPVDVLDDVVKAVVRARRLGYAGRT